MNRVAALADIYEVFGRCSKELQDTQAFPWDRKEAFDRLTKTLREMTCAIDQDEDLSAEHSMTALWPSLCSRDNIADEVSRKSSFVLNNIFISETHRLRRSYL